MAEFSDSIRREVFVPVPRQEVWDKAFGSPAALASWFPERVEGGFVANGEFTVSWGGHSCGCRMTAFEPGEVFAYQWHPGDALPLDGRPEGELTTVSFVFSDVTGGTRVTMVESGFSQIAADRRDWAFRQNDGGWDDELPKLSRRFAVEA